MKVDTCLNMTNTKLRDSISERDDSHSKEWSVTKMITLTMMPFTSETAIHANILLSVCRGIYSAVNHIGTDCNLD